MTGSSRQVPLFTPNIQKTLVCVNTADCFDFVDRRRHHFHIQLGNHSESESSRATETIYWNQRATVNLGQPLNKPFKEREQRLRNVDYKSNISYTIMGTFYNNPVRISSIYTPMVHIKRKKNLKTGRVDEAKPPLNKMWYIIQF